MARSKRAPYWADGYGTKDKPKRKRRANVQVRKADVASGGAYKKHSESWSICDWKFYDPKSAKVRRK